MQCRRRTRRPQQANSRTLAVERVSRDSPRSVRDGRARGTAARYPFVVGLAAHGTLTAALVGVGGAPGNASLILTF